ncbi:hypothetical protein [Nodosilinea sp. P-1105]|uniref:hypothetical protein n=1 Tax=Nodosilinea sp. P-1105 TaxID=2546229 RepID=UPI00197D9E89|nr:hypothetical protein [Nodosilinea sp. P-1105]
MARHTSWLIVDPTHYYQHSGQFLNANGRMQVEALSYRDLANEKTEKTRVSVLARKNVRTFVLLFLPCRYIYKVKALM